MSELQGCVFFCFKCDSMMFLDIVLHSTFGIYIIPFQFLPITDIATLHFLTFSCLFPSVRSSLCCDARKTMFPIFTESNASVVTVALDRYISCIATKTKNTREEKKCNKWTKTQENFKGKCDNMKTTMPFENG